jgi:DNA-binding transcriptional MerR regulator
MSDPHLRSVARQCGLTARELTRYIELELISLPVDEVGDATSRRLRRIRRLRRDLNIDLEVVAIIMRLLDRIEELESSRPPPSRFTARVAGEER